MRLNTISGTFVRTKIIERVMSEEHCGTELKNPNIHLWCTYFSREEQVKVFEDLSKDAYFRLIGDIARKTAAWVARWIVTSFSVKLILRGKKNLVGTSLRSVWVAVE